MSKKLAVFIDGTWNSADQHTVNGQPRPTNVFKMYSACTLSAHQRCYIEGVGVKKWERLRGGGFGYGISDNIKDGYRFLIENYDLGDEIYLIGFSRGAFAARSLAGLIRNLGMLKKENLALIDEAYDRYKDKDPDWHPDSVKAKAFRQANCWGSPADEYTVNIKFLGVFDTVGALGAPFGIVVGWVVDKLFKTRFHDTQISSIVENAYHALSIDESRLPFMPTLMGRNGKSHIVEEWFAGVHSDVGGGYEETGLSDITLQWMTKQAGWHGLNMDLSLLSPTVKPDVKTPPHNSQNLFYRAATVASVKLPGYVKLTPERYQTAVSNVQWDGGYLREIPNTNNIGDYVGNPPFNSNRQSYVGDVNLSVIDKINQCWNDYLPRNIA